MKPTEESKIKVETKIELSDEEIESVTGGVNVGNNYDTTEILEDTPSEKSTYTRAPRKTPSSTRFKR